MISHSLNRSITHSVDQSINSHLPPCWNSVMVGGMEKYTDDEMLMERGSAR